MLLRKQKHQKENNKKARKRKLAAEEDAVKYEYKEIILLDSNTDSSAAVSDASECEFVPSAPSNLSVKRCGRKEILTEEPSAALD